MSSAVIQQLATKHHLSQAAVAELWRAVQQGQGTAAQFNHPELGGMGQWLSGGMVMIGDFSNHALKAKVAQLCTEIASQLVNQPSPAASFTFASPAAWWPAELGTPSTTGSQNEMAYAYFASQHRLAVKIGRVISLYDTTPHHINGVAQQQSAGQTLTFRTQLGMARPEDFTLLHTSQL